MKFQQNLTFLGTSNKTYDFKDNKTGQQIAGTNYYIKFMDMIDKEVFDFKIKEDSRKLNELQMFENYLVKFDMFNSKGTNIVKFLDIEIVNFTPKK